MKETLRNIKNIAGRERRGKIYESETKLYYTYLIYELKN